MFSNTLSFLSYRNVSDQVSHPYKTTGKIIVLYILNWKTKIPDRMIASIEEIVTLLVVLIKLLAVLVKLLAVLNVRIELCDYFEYLYDLPFQSVPRRHGTAIEGPKPTARDKVIY